VTASAGSPATLSVADLGRVHFVGVGGAGMSGIARILIARGLSVSGSDAKDSRELAALRVLGADVHVGHRAEQVHGADTVVVSTAIRDDNVEVREARRLGLTVLRRAEALAAVMADRRSVAVAGTHGKTTTTSLLTVALQHCGVDPSFAIGGNLSDSGVNAHDGTGELFVAEADESDGSFLLLHPYAAIVTNVEADHLDHYRTVEAVHEAFDTFADTVDRAGFLVTCADDEGASKLARSAAARGLAVHTYGEGTDADVRVERVRLDGTGSSFDVVAKGRRLGPVRLRIPGRHNALNATAALVAGMELGLPESVLREGLAGFTGTRRRFELKGEAGGVRVFDDYAHHPTEIVAILRAARSVVDGGRLVVAFQPHRYTRTAVFREQFGAALALADEVVVLEVYPAGEDPVPGASGAGVAAAVQLPGHVAFEPSWSAVAGRLAELARPGDVVMTLGAGDVTMIGPEVVALLVARESA
jgi:UDP-N-acetylmuramate--alanine ligase